MTLSPFLYHSFSPLCSLWVSSFFHPPPTPVASSCGSKNDSSVFKHLRHMIHAPKEDWSLSVVTMNERGNFFPRGPSSCLLTCHWQTGSHAHPDKSLWPRVGQVKQFKPTRVSSGDEVNVIPSREGC